MSQVNTAFGGDYGDSVDPSRWVMIYPPYVDSTRKECEGRKIAKDKCVDKPNAVEIFDCATLLGFQTQLEMTKAYCRDYWIRGRVRVRLFDEEGKPVKEEIPSRRVLYAHVAALIPKHREHSKTKGTQSKASGSNANGDGGKGNVQRKGAVAPQKKKKKGKR